MNILLDTNILARMAQPGHSHHQAALDATDALGLRGDVPCLVPQVLYEFWVVATRPLDVNGLGWTPDAAREEVTSLLAQFPLLEDTPAIFPHWLNLVSRGISGKRVHDVRLQAVMLAHEITHLLTFNIGDFPAVEGITVVHPNEIAPAG